MTMLVLIYAAVTFLPMHVFARRCYEKKEIILFFILSTLGLCVWLSILLKHPFSPDTIVAWTIDRFLDLLP